jgi:YggT family protein
MADDLDRAPPTTTAAVDETRSVTYDPYAQDRRASYRLVQLVYLIFAIIEALLAIRFVLKALGANANAGFAQFIYGVTAPLVAPFLGLFGTPVNNNMVIEPGTIVALIVYPLIGWVLGKLLWIAIGDNRSAVTTRSRSVDTRVR